MLENGLENRPIFQHNIITSTSVRPFPFTPTLTNITNINQNRITITFASIASLPFIVGGEGNQNHSRMSVASDLNDSKAVDVDIDSFDVDGRHEATETDVGGANALFDDAVPRNQDEEVLVTSDGVDTIPLTSTESDLGDNIASPEISMVEEVDDSGGHVEAKAGDPPIDEIDETSSENNQEKIIIVPNFVDDPIILHVHSKKTKPKPRGDVHSDTLLSKHDVSEAHHIPAQSTTESADVSKRNLDGSDYLVGIPLSPNNGSTVGEAAPSSTDTKTENAQSKESEGSGDETVQQKQIKLVDYASKLAGAQILEHSPSFKGASNLLTGDKDKYSIAPCEDKKYVVIGLSEDILVKKIKLSNYERYSSRVKKFEVLASQEYPTPTEEHWNSIGTYEAHSKSGEQVFELENPTWARYLQFRFLSHYGSEHYCTLSQIKVHGSTMLQGFHEQWAESEKKDLGLEQVGETGEEDVIIKSEDNGLDNEKEQSQGTVKENTHETVEAGVENDLIEQPPKDKDRHDQPVGDLAATDVDQQDERENDMKLEPKAIEEETGTKGGKESTLEPATNETDPSENSDGEMSVTHETVQGDNESTLEGDTGLQVSADVRGRSYLEDAERVPTEANVSHATGAISFDNSESVAIGQQNDDIPPYIDESFSHQNANQTVDSDDGQVRDDSSIVSVKDAVKTVVADASDVIKNTTRGTIKNVKDTILTSVTKMGNSGLEIINVTAREERDDHSEEIDMLEKKTQELAQSIETSPCNNTALDVKPKAEEEAAIKIDTTDDDSKSENGPKIAKKDSKAAAGRDLLQRAIVTSKESEATKLFAALSRRFPNAKCLKDLDFQAFKAKTLLAGPGGSLGGGIKMEPIFTKITNEIKSVQSTQHLYEQYTTALKICYEAVLWNVANDLDTMQSSFDRIFSRLDMAEKELNRRPNSVSNLFSFIPVVFQSGCAFQPEQSTLAYASTFVIFLLLVRRFFRSKEKRGREEKIVEGVRSGRANLGHNLIAPKNDEKDNMKSDTADDIPVLISDKDLLAKELNHTMSRLAEKDEKLRCLQIQHTSLQERYFQLEQTISALESKIEQLTPAKDTMHVTRNGCTTPPPTVHCELLSSGIMTISPTEEKFPREQERIETSTIENI
jgi:hypothetical protein